MEGAEVAVAFHSDRDGAEATAGRVADAGRRAIVQKLDVADEGSVVNLFKSVSERLGPPSILVNNAGSMGANGKEIVDLSGQDFDRAVRTDLHGPFFCCREFVRRRPASGGGGRIVNVTSVHETIPSPRNAGYGAAKSGLLTFTRSLALEVAPLRINVNAIAPGLIRTPMTDDPETRAEELPNIPWRRPGEPWEVARLAPTPITSPDRASLSTAASN
jgi:glucose 1-dehydrogenase